MTPSSRGNLNPGAFLNPDHRSLFFLSTAVASLGLLLAGRVTAQTPTNVSGLPTNIGTIFMIGLENHNFTQPNPTSSPEEILTNPAAPYINSLITPGNSNAAYVSYALNYYNAGAGVHPSEPNYIWEEAGTDFGVRVDSDPSVGAGNVFNVEHFTRQLDAAGISWSNYQEDVEYTSPTVSKSGTRPVGTNPYNGSTHYNYQVKHNPMAFFTDSQTKNVQSLTNFYQNLTNNSLGRYNWITPNMDNCMHDGLSGGFVYHGVSYSGDQAAVAQGDNFLSIIVPQIMNSAAFQSNGVIILRWDESEGGDTTAYALPEIIISRLAKGNAYASKVVMSHSSNVRTMEEIFGLNYNNPSGANYLSNAIPSSETAATPAGAYNNISTVNDLSDMFEPSPSVLNIVLGSTNTISISWLSPSTNFILQQNTDLMTTNWVSVTNAVNSGSGSNQVTLPPVSGSAFFRLVSP